MPSSFSDLNTYSDTVLTFTDLRTAKVEFDRATPTAQSTSWPTGSYFDLPIGINIIDIILPDVELVYFQVNVSAASGATVTFPSLPAGYTVTNIGTGVYRVSNIQSRADWDLIKQVRVTPASTYKTNFTVSAVIGYETNKEKVWTTSALNTVRATLTSAFTRSITGRVIKDTSPATTLVARVTMVATGSRIVKIVGTNNFTTRFTSVTSGTTAGVVGVGTISAASYTPGTTSNASGPQIVDRNSGSTVWSILITTDHNAPRLATAGTGGSSVISGTGRLVTGTLTQVNSHLANLRITNTSTFNLSYNITYAISSNNSANPTFSVVQIANSSNVAFLSATRGQVSYYVNTPANVNNGPRIQYQNESTSIFYDYTMTIVPSDTSAISTLLPNYGKTWVEAPYANKSSYSGGVQGISADGNQIYLGNPAGASGNGEIRFYFKQQVNPQLPFWDIGEAITTGAGCGKLLNSAQGGTAMSGDGLTFVTSLPNAGGTVPLNTSFKEGYLYVYVRNPAGQAWTLQTTIQRNTTGLGAYQTNMGRYGVALSDDGNTLASASSDGGNISIYVRSGTAWAFQRLINYTNFRSGGSGQPNPDSLSRPVFASGSNDILIFAARTYTGSTGNWSLKYSTVQYRRSGGVWTLHSFTDSTDPSYAGLNDFTYTKRCIGALYREGSLSLIVGNGLETFVCYNSTEGYFYYQRNTIGTMSKFVTTDRVTWTKSVDMNLIQNWQTNGPNTYTTTTVQTSTPLAMSSSGKIFAADANIYELPNTSFNATTKTLTIRDVKEMINNQIEDLILTPATDYTADFDLNYTATEVFGTTTTMTKNQFVKKV